MHVIHDVFSDSSSNLELKSPTIRIGCLLLNDILRGFDFPKMQARQMKTTLVIRMLCLSHNFLPLPNKHPRAWQGLVLALSDPKVYVFALMTFTELLGLSFGNFFPT